MKQCNDELSITNVRAPQRFSLTFRYTKINESLAGSADFQSAKGHNESRLENADYKSALPGERTEQSFLVPRNEIVENAYDLSINRYKEIVYEEVHYDEPQVILERINGIEKEILADLAELKGMLG